MGPFSEAELRDMQGGHQERQEVSEDHAPINDGLPHHEFVPSEFAPDSGRCDKCGGGPLAPVHLKPVDQMQRIADALERIAFILEGVCVDYDVEGNPYKFLHVKRHEA